jgi:uncharacterized protein YcbX
MPEGRITAIYIYPIKACGSISLKQSPIAEKGLAFDRNWVIVDDKGEVLTQRDAHHLALIQPAVSEGGTLSLQAPGMAPLTVSPGKSDGKQHHVEVWDEPCVGRDQGDDVAQWLSDYLKLKCRLLRFDFEVSTRVTKQKKPDGVPSPLAFTDTCPLLVISEESLTHLNGRLQKPVEMSRFRPSLVIGGLGEFAEDKYRTMRTNGLSLHAAKPCARCVVVTIDQSDAVAKGPEPLTELSKYRKQGEKVMFGHYFMPASTGAVKIGDRIWNS